MLMAIGLDPAAETMYRRLVADVRLSAAGLVASTGLPEAVVVTMLTQLCARGLVVEEIIDSVATYSAAPPGVALGALLRERRDDLRTAELAVSALAEEHRLASIDHRRDEVVEVMTEISAVRHRFAQIQQAAQSEVLSMVTPNLTVVPHRDNAAGDTGLKRGVRYRAILDRRALSQPGMLGDVIGSIACGQEIRVAERVPLKLVIVDGERAMLPLHSHIDSHESVLVQSSGLLGALTALFETMWQRAHPLLTNPAGDGVIEVHPQLDEVDTQVLGLLLTGMTEEAIAGQLGTSRRTIQRRIHELMVKAGVETRIELGWHAARNAWV